MLRTHWLGIALALLAAATAACGSEALPLGVSAADGLTLAHVADGFDGPTQMARTPDGDLVIAELFGGERDATGRVLLVAADDWSQRTVLQTGLNKPTGVAVIGDELWIMEQRTLSVTTLVPGAERRVVLDEMPFNGRSQGTLTVTPDEQLLFNTSGAKRGANVTEGSGRLFIIDGPEGKAIEIASGLKHGYAHAWDPDGELWVTEMTDGEFDGLAAEDELVRVAIGDDLGWPRCVGDNRPVIEYGGTVAGCEALPASHALFRSGATPTAVAIAPWDTDLLLVALWTPSEVRAIPRTAGKGPHPGEIVVSGVESPQSLLVDEDCVLLADHESGAIFRLCAA